MLGSVFAELGVDLLNKMGEAPTTSMAAPAAGEGASSSAAALGGMAAGGGGSGAPVDVGDAGGDDLDAELQRRLDNLRRT